MGRSRRQNGYTLVEMLVALGVVAVLVALAFPLYVGMRDQSVETAAQTELREALVPLQAHILDGDETLSIEQGVRSFSSTVRFDGGAVAGIKLQEAADGSACLWKVADSGSVFGVWTADDGSVTLYAEVAALPEDCPTSADAPGEGFTATW